MHVKFVLSYFFTILNLNSCRLWFPIQSSGGISNNGNDLNGRRAFFYFNYATLVLITSH